MQIQKNGIISFVLLLVSIVFSLNFEHMAYWNVGAIDGMIWFWIGAFLSYTFSLLAVFWVFFKTKPCRISGVVALRLTIIFLLATGNILWTTFVILAGLSGM